MITLISSARRFKAAYTKYSYLFHAFGLSAVGLAVFAFLASSTGSLIFLATAFVIFALIAVNAVYYIIIFRRDAEYLRENEKLYT